METLQEKPSLRYQRLASDSLGRFITALPDKHTQQVRIRLQASEEAIILPRKALELLRVILAGMAQGQAVSLVVADAQVSTQQAAAMLNVSRPHLVKLLEKHELPFTKAGTHRRLLVADVLAYKDQQAKHRQHQLQLLVQQAQELQLGYE